MSDVKVLGMAIPEAARWLERVSGLSPVFETSVSPGKTSVLAVAGRGKQKRLLVVGKNAPFEGEVFTVDAPPGKTKRVKLCNAPFTWNNAQRAMGELDWLKLVPIGREGVSMGFGDRMGNQTPGHLRAVKALRTVRPIRFAVNLSPRERERLSQGFRPNMQFTDVTTFGLFGALQEGWRGGIAIDADHIHDKDALREYMAAGATLVTLDGIHHVITRAQLRAGDRAQLLDNVPWQALETGKFEAIGRYVAGDADLGQSVQEVFIQFGGAIAFFIDMIRECEKLSAGRPYEIEISLDELGESTSALALRIILGELRRVLGSLFSKIVSVAPCWEGRAEKGVDWIGNLDILEHHATQIKAVLDEFGQIRVSQHTGSDKFVVYPILRRVFGDLVHIKTAGTWWLEACRLVAYYEPRIFVNMATMALRHYGEERRSYHVCAEPTRCAPLETYRPEELPTLLNDLNWRQMLHVCFGKLLAEYGEGIMQICEAHEERWYEFLERHARMHLALLV